MQHEVIMPALGMSQDSGRILAWRKAAGERVAAGEALMEIETDKAVVEIEAECGGILVERRAEEGDEVPVGRVVAVIVPAGAEAAADPPRPAPLPPPPPLPLPPAARAPAPAAPASRKLAAAPPAPPPPPSAGADPQPPVAARPLASPLARRRAAERGVDLAMLAAAGLAQPFHVRDVEAFHPPPGTGLRIVARAEDGVAPLIAWTAAEGHPVQRSRLLAAIAAAALRCRAPAAPIVVAVSSPGAAPQRMADPDLARLGAAAGEAPDGGQPALTLRDLAGTPFLEVWGAGASAGPVLTVAPDGGAIRLMLETPAGGMTEAEAMALLAEVALRCADPRRLLL